LSVAESILKEKFENIQEQSVEFAKEVRQANFVYKVTQNDKEIIFHLEIQTDNDDTMLERMLLYAALLYEKYKIPVKQAVLYLGRATNAEANMVTKKDIGYFSYQYALINISQIDYKVFLKFPKTLVFAILANFGTSSLKQF
jgi:hypothetical protein